MEREVCFSNFIRNKVTNLLKQAKMDYFSGINLLDPKSFWKAPKVLLKKEPGVPFLNTSDGKVISDDVDKANTLNEFFTSCLTTRFIYFQVVIWLPVQYLYLQQ